LNTSHFTLHTSHFTLHTSHFTLHTSHFTLHTHPTIRHRIFAHLHRTCGQFLHHAAHSPFFSTLRSRHECRSRRSRTQSELARAARARGLWDDDADRYRREADAPGRGSWGRAANVSVKRRA